MKNPRLRKLIRELISAKLDLSTDKKIAQGMIGKTLLNTHYGDEYKILNILGFKDDVGVDKNLNMAEFEVWDVTFQTKSKVVLDIESIMDLLIGKTAEKMGYPFLKLAK